jgi:aminoglycoside 2'-N-acetyltransferase I
VIAVRTAHTAQLDPGLLAEARSLVWAAFDDIEDSDWDHALGGIHALAYEGSELVGHASVVQRQLLHGGRALRCGYVEAVAVRAGARGRGHASAMMEALERVIRGAYELGALGASDDAARLYAGRGWRLWSGPLSALTPDGVVPTPDEAGGIYVLPVDGGASLDLSGELTCDWREGDVW